MLTDNGQYTSDDVAAMTILDIFRAYNSPRLQSGVRLLHHGGRKRGRFDAIRFEAATRASRGPMVRGFFFARQSRVIVTRARKRRRARQRFGICPTMAIARRRMGTRFAP